LEYPIYTRIASHLHFYSATEQGGTWFKGTEVHGGTWFMGTGIHGGAWFIGAAIIGNLQSVANFHNRAFN